MENNSKNDLSSHIYEATVIKFKAEIIFLDYGLWLARYTAQVRSVSSVPLAVSRLESKKGVDSEMHWFPIATREASRCCFPHKSHS